jgi:hypothetical protein
MARLLGVVVREALAAAVVLPDRSVVLVVQRCRLESQPFLQTMAASGGAAAAAAAARASLPDHRLEVSAAVVAGRAPVLSRMLVGQVAPGLTLAPPAQPELSPREALAALAARRLE